MAKSLLRLEARKLRKRGVSVRKIAQTLDLSKSTVSEWVRDVILTVNQLETLRAASIKGAELGRLRGALIQKERRINLIEDLKKAGVEELSTLIRRELLVAGVALYWGEGSRKSNRGISFCNSDPRMIKFLIRWLIDCFGVRVTELRCRVGINFIHTKRDAIVKAYWSTVTSIPLKQFRKTSFKKVNNRKVYENFNDHYGTLTVEVAKSRVLYYKVLGLIEGLCQGSSMAEHHIHNVAVVGSNPTPGT